MGAERCSQRSPEFFCAEKMNEHTSSRASGEAVGCQPAGRSALSLVVEEPRADCLPVQETRNSDRTHENLFESLEEGRCLTPPQGPPRHFKVGALYPLVPGRLYFTAHSSQEMTRQAIQEGKGIFFTSTGLHESYLPFCADYGPVNLATVVHFCEFLHEKMTEPRLRNRPIVYYIDNREDYLANAAFLMSAYLVLYHSWSPEEAAKPFQNFSPNPFIPFRDASFTRSLWDLEIIECIRAVESASKMGWLNIQNFDMEEYEFLDDPENGDIHQVCEKFLAFRGPQDKPDPEDEFAFPPSHYVPIFQEKQVEAVIRLNYACTYDPAPFTQAGIAHYDLYFHDCTVPAPEIFEEFMAICERHKGLIAVHCYAGLGRTGTLIALWMMQQHDISAAQAIAWLRIVRPGSVIGPQQQFLVDVERGLICPEKSSGIQSLPRSPSSPELLSAQLSEQVTDGRKSRDARRVIDP